MEHEHVLSGLRRKRGDIAGEINQLGARLTHLRADLDCLDRAIRIFDPEASPETIRPIAKRKKPDHFLRGEFTRAIMTVLRHAEAPMSAADIAGHVATHHGLGTAKHATRNLVEKTKAALARQNGKALVCEGGRGAASMWRVA